MRRLRYKDGIFTADRLKLKETAINNLVLRVNLPHLVSVSKKGRFKTRESPRIRNQRDQKKEIIVKHKQNGIVGPKVVENKDDNFKRKNPKLLNGSKKKKIYNLEFIDTNKRYELVTKKFHQPFNPQLMQYDFNKLVNDMKFIKLPTKDWKIKVYKRRKQVTSISFSNFLLPERSVTFEYNLKQFHLIIDGRIAILLGSPKHINSKYDLEILLNIIDKINSNNEMLYYKSVKIKV